MPSTPGGAWQCRHAPHSKKSAQIVGRVLRRAPQAKGRDKPPVFVHQIDDSGVIHRVVAAFKWYLLEIHMIGARDRRDRWQVAGQSDETRIKSRQIILKRGRVVTLGIDADEQDAHLIGIAAEFVENVREFQQGGWASVRAVRKPEEHQERFALEVGIRKGTAVLVNEAEGAADRG